MAERAELLLRQAARFGLHTRAACVEYLGNLFRAALDAPARKTDYQVGLVGWAALGWLARLVGPGSIGLAGSIPGCTAAWATVLQLSGKAGNGCMLCVLICWPLTAGRTPTHLQVGEQLLRDLLFIHLDEPADKLQLTVQMLLKLYALVSRERMAIGLGDGSGR